MFLTTTDPGIKIRQILPEPFVRDDVELVESFIEGDDRAFVALFERHNTPLYLYAARILGDAGVAEDIVQELWERVVHLRTKPQSIHNPLGFLLTIVRNLSLNYLKKERRKVLYEREIKEREAGSDPVGNVQEAVIEGLEQLPLKYREVLVLNIYSGYTFDEIADMLEISTEAAWKRASRARKELRTIVLRHISSTLTQKSDL